MPENHGGDIERVGLYLFSDYAMADFDILMEPACHIFTSNEVILLSTG